jgi:hypothetical protein
MPLGGERSRSLKSKWESSQLHRAELPTERIPSLFWRSSGPGQMHRWKCTQRGP